jgi:Elongation factor G C-terminus
MNAQQRLFGPWEQRWHCHDTTTTPSSDIIYASVPVRRAFGLPGELRGASRGHAHCVCSFSGMKMVSSHEQDNIIADTRVRMNLDKAVPVAACFVDRLLEATGGDENIQQHMFRLSKLGDGVPITTE